MSGINPLTSVGGTNLLGGGLLNDPRMGIVNSLMSSGMDASPVRSGWQEAARAVQGIVGALMYNKVQGENADAMQGLDAYMKADPATQIQMAKSNPRLAQIAGVMGMQSSLIGQEARAREEAKKYAPYNLAPGENRMGPDGNVIASGPSLWMGGPDLGGGAPTAPATPAAPAISRTIAPPAVATSPLGPDGEQKIAMAENATGNPAAKNPNSSATGDGQFIDGTWLEQFKKNYPDQAKGMSDPDILALRSNPALSRQMIGNYARDNYATLTGRGIQNVGVPELSLAHAVGPTGAYNVLTADPATPIDKVLTPDAISANPQFAGKTTGEVRQWAADRVGPQAGSQTAQAAPGAPQAAPEVRWAQQRNVKTGAVMEFAVDPTGKPILDERGQPYLRPFMTAPTGQRRTLAGTMEVDPTATAAARATKIAEGEASLSAPPEGTPMAPGTPNTIAGAQSYNTAAGSKAAEIAAAPQMPLTPQARIESQQRANTEFMNNPQVKEHYEVAKNFQSVMDSAKGTDKASDINLIDGLVKMFNDVSTVRQSTFENFMEHSQGLPDNIKGMVAAWYSNGQHLQPETRQQLVDQAQIRMLSSRQSYDQFASAASETAAKNGLDPTSIVPKFEDPLQKIERERAQNGQAASAQPASIPLAAVDHLKSNPSLAAAFDQKYGAGASARYLGR